jgi:hypothetical protein
MHQPGLPVVLSLGFLLDSAMRELAAAFTRD